MTKQEEFDKVKRDLERDMEFNIFTKLVQNTGETEEEYLEREIETYGRR